MRASLIGILSETSIHPGTESSSGIVDLPVAREVSTNYPVIVGSSLKGAIRENFEDKTGGKIADEIFGMPDKVGQIATTDARLLLLPVRTLVGHYRWITCPYIIERFLRDLKLSGQEIAEFSMPSIEQGGILSHNNETEIFLEEITFVPQNVKDNDILVKIVELIKPLIYHQSLKNRLLEQVAIISDEDFAYYAKYGLEVRARNKLEKITKTSANLWYEECLPSDTLFYSILLCRNGNEKFLDKLLTVFKEEPYLQIGGNETIGQGWCVVKSWEGEA